MWAGTVKKNRARADVPIGTEHWLEKQRSLWERRLEQLDVYLMTLKEQSQ